MLERTLLLILVASGFLACDGTSNGDDSQLSRDVCQEDCGSINFATECLTASELSDCRDACLTESPNDVKSFSDCVSTGGSGASATFNDGTADCPERQCLSILGVGEETNGSTNGSTNNTVSACKTSCDEFNDCVTETAQVSADCKAACETANDDAIASWQDCIREAATCSSGPDCYDHLGIMWVRDCSDGEFLCADDKTCTDGECL